MIVPVFKPSINRKDMDSVLSCMVSDEIGPGVITTQFAKSLAEYMKVPGALVFREQGKALELALDSLSLEPGRKILLSPLSPGWYLELLHQRQLVPVYADVDASTACLGAEALATLQKEGDFGAVLLHYPLGMIPQAEAFRETGVPVVEDITTVFGAGGEDKRVGTSASYAVMSLEEDGIITAAGGSAFFSSSRGILGDCKKQSEKNNRSSAMTNMNAALGMVQIRQVDDFLKKRREIYDVFLKSIMKTKHRSLTGGVEVEGVPYSFPVVLKSGVQNTLKYAAKHNIRVVPAFEGCALSLFQDDRRPCPQAEALYLRSVLFPLYPRLAGQSIQLISKVLSTLP